MKDDREKMLADLLDRATSVEVCVIDEARGEHRRTCLSDEQMAILANAVNAANTPSFNDAIEAAAKVADELEIALCEYPSKEAQLHYEAGALDAAVDIAQKIRALALLAPGGKK